MSLLYKKSISGDMATVVKKKKEWVSSHGVKEVYNYPEAEVTASLKEKATEQKKSGCKNEGKRKKRKLKVDKVTLESYINLQNTVLVLFVYLYLFPLSWD